MTALEIIEKIRKEKRIDIHGVIVDAYGKKLTYRDYLLKAFNVMREIAIELQNQNLYRLFLAGKIKREDLKRSEEQVDRSFQISMEMAENKEP